MPWLYPRIIKSAPLGGAKTSVFKTLGDFNVQLSPNPVLRECCQAQLDWNHFRNDWEQEETKTGNVDCYFDKFSWSQEEKRWTITQGTIAGDIA